MRRVHTLKAPIYGIDGANGNGVRRRRRGVALAAVVCAAAACGPRAPAPAPASASRADPDFLAPPVVMRADVDPTGAFVVAGRAPPRARVALSSPSGERVEADGDGEGDWTLVLAPSDQPRAFALTAAPAGAGRLLRGEGAVLAAPGALAPVTVLRAGAPAWPVRAAGAGLRWTGVDFDGGGGAAASGFAAPGAPVNLAVDGATSGAGVADAAGRFGVLWLGPPLAPGPHQLVVSTPSQSMALTLSLRTAPLAGAPVRISREASGWRVDWTPPGGGVQSHLALTAAPPQTRSPA